MFAYAHVLLVLSIYYVTLLYKRCTCGGSAYPLSTLVYYLEFNSTSTEIRRTYRPIHILFITEYYCQPMYIKG